MPNPDEDKIDWELTTWEGNRRRQMREFAALSFREKLQCLEDFAEIEAFFANRKANPKNETVADNPPLD